jgi:hypothetical protein
MSMVHPFPRKFLSYTVTTCAFLAGTIPRHQSACNGLKSMELGASGFRFPMVWCSKTCDHPEEDLAKSGYGPDMNFFLKNPFISWQPYWNLL